MKHLILGGARSGKSKHAEKTALSRDGAESCVFFYVATAQALDVEMQARINEHQARRGPPWQLIESPLVLAETLSKIDKMNPNCCVLIDCLTLWLSNCLHADTWPEECEQFLQAVEAFQGQLIMVSNEVGSGIVPMGALSRTFVDEAGRLNQTLAGMCDKVSLVVAGLATELKNGH